MRAGGRGEGFKPSVDYVVYPLERVTLSEPWPVLVAICASVV